MDTFLPVLFWGLAILAALTGWGRLLARSCPDGTNNAADWLEAPARGIAISSFIGSLMNLAGLATRAGVALFILAGCALTGLSLVPLLKNIAKPSSWRRPSRDWKWLVVLALPLSALALRFGSSVLINTYLPYAAGTEHIYFNPQDDALSYLVSPERMLQTGSLGHDPFNSRQMMSALGAQHFLNAMALAIFPPENVHVIEGGVALAAACLAAAGLGARLQLGRTGATLLTFVPLLFRPWYINISSLTTTVAVLIALCSALVQLFSTEKSQKRWLLTSGLLLGAACSLKSTTVPTAVILVAAASALSTLNQKSWRPLGLGLLVGLMGLATMLPWMWWQLHSSGTLLYPLLGRGFHIEVYFPSVSAPFHGDAVHELEIGLILPIALLIGLLLAWTMPAVRATVDQSTACVTVAIVAAWAVTWPLLAISTEYNVIARYLLAAQITALTVVLAGAGQAGLQLGRQPGWRWARFTGPLLLVALLLGYRTELYIGYGQIAPHDLANSIVDRPYFLTTLTPHVHRAQAAVPADAKILAYTDTPFLFDFNSNPIFVADWPGEASPPPGMPVHQGGEAVAAFLLGQDIRYLIYSYKNKANYSRAFFQFNLDPSVGRVMNRQAGLAFAFQDDLTELGQTRAHLFDDGYFYVLDLAHRQPPKSTHP